MPKLSESSSRDEGPISGDFVQLFATEEIETMTRMVDKILIVQIQDANASSGKGPGKNKKVKPCKKTS